MVTDPAGPTGPTGPTNTSAAAFTQIGTDLNAIDQAAPTNVTPVEFLAAAPNASYTGKVTFFDGPSDFLDPSNKDIAGDLSLAIDFGALDLDGTVSNLVRRDGVSFAGDLTLSAGNAFRNDDGGFYSADIIGRVTDTAGNDANFNTSLALGKAFGAEADAIRGITSGRIEYLGTNDIRLGAFAVTKD